MAKRQEVFFTLDETVVRQDDRERTIVLRLEAVGFGAASELFWVTYVVLDGENKFQPNFNQARYADSPNSGWSDYEALVGEHVLASWSPVERCSYRALNGRHYEKPRHISFATEAKQPSDGGLERGVSLAATAPIDADKPKSAGQGGSRDRIAVSTARNGKRAGGDRPATLRLPEAT